MISEETLRVLEYERIKTLLAGFTASEPGRARVRALLPYPDPAQAAESLGEVSEMTEVLEVSGVPPVGGFVDLKEPLGRLRAEGTWLPPEGLLEILGNLEAAGACRRYFVDQERAPRLAGRARGLQGYPDLRQEIRTSIGARGEILDSASFELGEIRREIQQLRGRIRRALEGMLSRDGLAGAFQERIVTERNGRYVVPVRSDHRGQVKGFVHDESASGQTLFVEPTQVLESNNHLHALLRGEQREIERVLRRISASVRSEIEGLLENQEILAHLDYTAAAGRFSVQIGGVAPRLTQERVLEIRAARHPLLLLHLDGRPREGEAVPIDLILSEGRDALVISGPNTGGKTVGLKTAGLLILMVRSGLHIPCSPNSRIHLFRSVFADIGDEQSIEENLSTFSGHLVRIREILRQADGDSLVLLDEAGTGTDPGEGGALAMAVLDSLRARGARVVVTTHLNLIKSWAHLQGGVENAAVEFDSRTLEPTYRLHYGIPGASNAFTIAGRLGLPREVLEQAQHYLGKGEMEGLALIEELNEMRKELRSELSSTRHLQEEARRERDRRKALLKELEEQKRGILDKASRRAESRVREAERHLKSILEQARQAGQPPERARLAGELKQVRQDLSELRAAPPRRSKPPGEVAPGELVRIPSLGSEAEVLRVQGKQVELSLGGKRLRLPLKDLEAFSPRKYAAPRHGGGKVRTSVSRKESFEPRLMLVGKRVEEALPLLDRFIDDALLQGIREVEVVHGAGEGVLRRVVRDFLAEHRGVVAFHAADQKFGGENVTVVELRE